MQIRPKMWDHQIKNAKPAPETLSGWSKSITAKLAIQAGNQRKPDYSQKIPDRKTSRRVTQAAFKFFSAIDAASAES